MREYPFDYQKLFQFAASDPYQEVGDANQSILNQLEGLRSELNFPAIQTDIGLFIKFMLVYWKPKVIFEMGSGYGHSAFWFLSANTNIEKIILTEKRSDLKQKFMSVNWPARWQDKMEYHQGDAFDTLSEIGNIDLALIDGVKGDYLKFLLALKNHTQSGALVLIDNSYWRGSFLDDEVVAIKKSPQKIKELHEYIAHSSEWESLFIPFVDGLSILRKI